MRVSSTIAFYVTWQTYTQSPSCTVGSMQDVAGIIPTSANFFPFPKMFQPTIYTEPKKKLSLLGMFAVGILLTKEKKIDTYLK